MTVSSPNAVLVIDTATNSVIATVPVGVAPSGVAFTPDGARAYVTNDSDSNSVSVIDTASNTVIATVEVGTRPVGVAITPSRKWYVDGMNGCDSNACKSPETACKTIGQAIGLASSGDSIMVAPAIYPEVLTINSSLNIIGAGATKTIIEGGRNGTVVTIPDKPSISRVTLSGVSILGGYSARDGGGVSNYGRLTITNSLVGGNTALFFGGGISSHGDRSKGAGLLINNSTIANNKAPEGGGIQCSVPGTMTINNSTISGNRATKGNGGGILTSCQLTINNSTISGDIASAGSGGGIYFQGAGMLNNVTLSGNSALNGGGMSGGSGGTILQNSIVANSPSGGNCSGSRIFSNGYNLSSDGTCSDSTSAGDLNNTDPKLGPLQNNGGPTQTQGSTGGSPAIDAATQAAAPMATAIC